MASDSERSVNEGLVVPPALSIPIGNVIKAWREHRGWGVTEFATRAQVPKGYISSLEHNRIEQPANQRLVQLAHALGIEVWDILARRLPNDTEGEGEQRLVQGASAVSQTPTAVAPRKRQLRFGSGVALAPKSRAEILQAVLHQLDKTKQLVEQLLRDEEKAK